MKITRHDVKLLLALGGILVFVALYYFVYTPMIEDTEDLSREYNLKKAELSLLQDYYEDLDENNANAILAQENIQTIVDSYPRYVEDEDFLLYLIEWQDKNDLNFISYGFGDGEIFAEIPVYLERDVDGVVGPVLTNLQGGKVSMNLSGSFSYTQLKNAINTVSFDEDRTVIDNISISYAGTGDLLNSTITLSKFYLNWEGAEYIPPELPDVSIGNDNLFIDENAVNAETETAPAQEVATQTTAQ